MMTGSVLTEKGDNMIAINKGIKTEVSILRYEVSTIDKHMYIQSCGMPFYVRSVDGYDDLVEIELPTGEHVIAKADQIITAVKKCVA